VGRYINSVPQILDSNGKPIAGAKKFFFETETTTKKTIYSDSGLSVSTANPALSDASGRMPEIFLDGIYAEEQQDNSGTATGYDGVTLWTRDPIGDITEGQFESWLNDSTYNIPDIIVGSDDEYYRSLSDGNQGNDPTTSVVSWEMLRLGRVWNANITYGVGDSVYGSDGYLYLSKVSSNLNNNPSSDTANWRPAANTRFVKGADIASAATLTLGSDGNYFDITGSATIGAINTVGVDTIVKLHFDGALTLTYDSISFILPGAADITTAAGDEMEMVEFEAAKWRCTIYTKADGSAVVEPTPTNEQKLVKAWINMDGTGTISNRDSFGVSSIVDNGVGSYTVNLSSTMGNDNFPAIVTASGVASDSLRGPVELTRTTSSVVFKISDSTSTVVDVAEITVTVFGDE